MKPNAFLVKPSDIREFFENYDYSDSEMRSGQLAPMILAEHCSSAVRNGVLEEVTALRGASVDIRNASFQARTVEDQQRLQDIADRLNDLILKLT
jgi:hypothetical protein